MDGVEPPLEGFLDLVHRGAEDRDIDVLEPLDLVVASLVDGEAEHLAVRVDLDDVGEDAVDEIDLRPVRVEPGVAPEERLDLVPVVNELVREGGLCVAADEGGERAGEELEAESTAWR